MKVKGLRARWSTVARAVVQCCARGGPLLLHGEHTQTRDEIEQPKKVFIDCITCI